MTTHFIPLEARALNGSFSTHHPPLITIASGDTVRFATLDGDWLNCVDEGPQPKHGSEWHARRPGVDAGHALIGPIKVLGAQPGSTLAVRIDHLAAGEWGWSRAGGQDSELDRALGVSTDAQHYLRWTLDSTTAIATSNEGNRVRMRPFLGVIGATPNQPGILSTHPPRRTGGNLDCKELIVGTTLYLPVEVPGAMLMVGDGHAAQGDGEAGSTAIECPMQSVVLTITVVEDFPLSSPRAWTPDSWITFGFGESLDAAALHAFADMVDLLQADLGVKRPAAMNLASQTVDLRITQIVNGIRGVHAVITHERLALLRPSVGSSSRQIPDVPNGRGSGAHAAGF